MPERTRVTRVAWFRFPSLVAHSARAGEYDHDHHVACPVSTRILVKFSALDPDVMTDEQYDAKLRRLGTVAVGEPPGDERL